MSQSRFNIETRVVGGIVLLFFFAILILLSPFLPAQQPQPAPKGYTTNGAVFLGWMKYAAHVQIRFLNGGHTTYGQEQMKDITKELQAGLKCVQEKK